MPQKRKSMKQIRKILELHLQAETMSIRTIAQAARVSRPVVKQYIDRYLERPLTLDEVRKLSDTELCRHLELEKPVVQETEENKVLLEWLHSHIERLHRKGMTRRILHEDYLSEHPGGLQYSQFCFVLAQRYQSIEASSLFDHTAGDKLYVDFTGKKAKWLDGNGKTHTEEVFLAVLGASGYLFSVPTISQKQEDLANAMASCFHALGGVPQAVVPDCLKSAVLKNDGWEPVINPLFQKVMEHYHTVCLPARPRRPKDKPLAEASVNLIYRQIFSRLEDQVFQDRQEMLRWWQTMVDRINKTPFQKLPGSRASRYQAIDQPALKPLPETRFDVLLISSQSVPNTGVVYISQDKTYYSVPYSLRGKKVEVLVFADRIEIWHENLRWAVHQRQAQAGQVILPEHRPPRHRRYADRGNETEIFRCLKLRGPHTLRWANMMGEGCEHEDQKWRLLHGLLNLADRYPHRIDWVCRLALRDRNYTLKHLRLIIRTEADIDLSQDEENNLELPFGDFEELVATHENIRGASHYCRQIEEVLV